MWEHTPIPGSRASARFRTGPRFAGPARECRGDDGGGPDERVARFEPGDAGGSVTMSISDQRKYTQPEKDELYDLLSNHRRRYVIHFCKQADEPLTLSDLAERVAAREQDKSVAELTSAERKRVYTSLQQTHLDRLADAGMIEFDGDEVELTNGAAELDVYLDVVPEGSIPWGIYYLGLSLLSVVVLGGVWIGFVPTETVPELGWAALILAVFLVSSVAQVVQNRRYRLGDVDEPP